MQLTDKDIQRFHSKYEELTEDECWEWLSMRDKGYGLFHINRDGRTIRLRAHRIAWMLANHEQIPDDKVILHECNNSACVNPAHLKCGTQAQNMKQASEQGRMVGNISPGIYQVIKTHCPKGHQYDEQNTIVTKQGRQCRICKNEANKRYHNK